MLVHIEFTIRVETQTQSLLRDHRTDLVQVAVKADPAKRAPLQAMVLVQEVELVAPKVTQTLEGIDTHSYLNQLQLNNSISSTHPRISSLSPN